MSSHGKIEGRITIDATWELEIADSGGAGKQVTLTAGDYYWSSGDTGDDLLTMLTDRINAVSVDTWVLSLSAAEGGTGQLTIDDPDHGAWSVTWSDSRTRIVCGFDADTGAQSTPQTGANHVRGLWLPDGPLNARHGHKVAQRETDAQILESPGGQVFGVYGQRKAVYSIDWTVTRSRTHVQAETVAGESFEQFWIDVFLGELQTGGTAFANPIRVYWDADTDSEYVTVRAAGNAYGALDPAKLRDDWTGLYRVALDRLVEIP